MAGHIRGGGITDIREDSAIVELCHTLTDSEALSHTDDSGGQFDQTALVRKGQKPLKFDKGPSLDSGEIMGRDLRRRCVLRKSGQVDGKVIALFLDGQAITHLLVLPEREAMLARLRAVLTGWAGTMAVDRVPGHGITAADHGTAAIVFGEQAASRQDGLRTAEGGGQVGELRL